MVPARVHSIPVFSHNHNPAVGPYNYMHICMKNISCILHLYGPYQPVGNHSQANGNLVVVFGFKMCISLVFVEGHYHLHQSRVVFFTAWYQLSTGWTRFQLSIPLTNGPGTALVLCIMPQFIRSWVSRGGWVCYNVCFVPFVGH